MIKKINNQESKFLKKLKESKKSEYVKKIRKIKKPTWTKEQVNVDYQMNKSSWIIQLIKRDTKRKTFYSEEAEETTGHHKNKKSKKRKI